MFKNSIERFKSNFAAARNSEQGDIVQTLIIIAVFVFIVVVVGALLRKTIVDKANAVSDCIAGSGAGAGTAKAKNC